MTRRKNTCFKWTVVLVLVVFCPNVLSRPQDASTNSVNTEITTEKIIRYTFNNSLRLFSSKLPIVISSVTNPQNPQNKTQKSIENISKIFKTRLYQSEKVNPNLNIINRTSRLIKSIVIKDMNKNINKNDIKPKPTPSPSPYLNKIKLTHIHFNKRKPEIKKVMTKWKDETKYEDLNFPFETTTSDEIDSTTHNSFDTSEQEKSTERTKSKPLSKKRQPSNYYSAPAFSPQNEYTGETHVYSGNVQIIDKFPSQSTHMYTNRPSPTPEITNVGYPKPWHNQNHQVHRKPTTQKPAKVTKPLNYNFHNPISNKPSNNYEVTTFEPSSAYTERIVIRPEVYSGTNEDCPTIYLTLNNTFLGQAKEACPDLNIAVNTNVVNKNNVIESEEEEEETESLFPNGFGIPLGDDSTPEDSAGNDYFGSNENNAQGDSASVEGTELANYNAANAIQSESAEPGSSFSPSAPIHALGKPGRPHKDEDDIFSFISLVDFFRPAINALGWLASINPFAIGLFPLLLAPIAFLFAGSGLAALFSPWFLPLGREAPKIIHIYRPYWHWDDTIKTWHLHSFPDNRQWKPYYRDSEEKVDDTTEPSAYEKLKDWMSNITKMIRDRYEHMRTLSAGNKKTKRKKRRTWSSTSKYVSSTNLNAKETKVLQTPEQLASSTIIPESSRDVKNKVPIRESIKLVANQLLDKPNITSENAVVIDTRIPPKVKLQAKHKIKTRNEDGEEPLENAHIGEAVPVTMEELESENNVSENESTTSKEGISTWVLVSNPVSKDNTTFSTEPTKTEDTKKQKPQVAKNKNKKPQNNKTQTKRPSNNISNKSDESLTESTNNEQSKVKNITVSEVQKDKKTSVRPNKIVSTTSGILTEVTPKPDNTTPAKATTSTKLTTKTKKKNKNKQKVSSTTEETIFIDSALLPTEAKEQEIELEVSTPPVTTKKPKRNATKKKNKTKKRKTSKPKPENETSISEIKTSNNKTKSAKPSKKPQPVQGAITSQLYNYFSREVMPSVGVGVLGLASIVGIASYFLYPFSTPVRRTFEVDKRDDLYKNNAEDYANDGNGQAEEDMLGTVLAGMPAHAKNKLNPYAAQTAYINRYPVKKEQDLRYRHVATKYEPTPTYNTRYPQQKTGIAHGAVYSRPVNYSPHYETRHAYTTEGKFNFDKLPTSYAPYPAVEPAYTVPETAPLSSGISSYGNDASNSVVYGIKPSSETDFKPVYPFEGQFYSETTDSPATYAPTSLYLGSNNDKQQFEESYAETSSASNENDENKFVVGNVPKELSENATPAVVPEHGPRKLNRKKRSLPKRSISSSLEEILRKEKENKDIFISNEIDDSYVVPLKKLAPLTETILLKDELPTPGKPEEVYTVYASSVDPTQISDESTTTQNDIVESVSTFPINDERKSNTETNDVEVTTKVFKVYEVFTAQDVSVSPIINNATEKAETTTQFRNMMTETTTELKSDTTSTMPPSPTPFSDSKDPLTSTLKPTPILPDVVTYPPLNESNSFFSFLKRMLEFKVKLGMSIVQNVGESMEKFLKSFDTQATAQRVAKASQNINKV